MRVKCLAQEHNTMTPARACTRAARPGDERTNHEATVAPEYYLIVFQRSGVAIQVLGCLYISQRANTFCCSYGVSNYFIKKFVLNHYL